MYQNRGSVLVTILSLSTCLAFGGPGVSVCRKKEGRKGGRKEGKKEALGKVGTVCPWPILIPMLVDGPHSHRLIERWCVEPSSTEWHLLLGQGPPTGEICLLC